MKTLFINACVREDSRTCELAKRLLCRLGEYEEINLEERGLLPLNAERLRRRDELSRQMISRRPNFLRRGALPRRTKSSPPRPIGT